MKIGADPRANPSETLQAAMAETQDSRERQFLGHLYGTLDLTSYRDLQEYHLKAKSKPAKFLDLTAWMRHKYALVERLGLVGTTPIRVLDIGCGPSHFGAVSRWHGHDVVGLDVPGNALYGDLNDFFGLQRIVHPVRPMRPLPSRLGRFEFITALSANFYQRPDDTLFSVDEWQFFLRDLVDNHLTAGGRIFFNLNPLPDHQGLHFWDDAFVDLMSEIGGVVDRDTGFVDFNHHSERAA